jgi:hypothetical protein
MSNELLIERRVEIKRYPKHVGADDRQEVVRVARTSPEGWMLQLRGQTQMATADYLSREAALAIIAKLQAIVTEIDGRPSGVTTVYPRNMAAFPDPEAKPVWFWPLADDPEERGSEG